MTGGGATVVPDALDGERVDRVIALVTGCSRSTAAALVAAGAVLLDDEVVTTRSAKVSAGQSLTVPEVDLDPRAAEPDPSVELVVVHEDDDVLVVDKPAGLVVHPAAGHPTGTLAQALAARGIAAHRGGIVHRLDRDTSGLLLAAKDDATLRVLQDALRARRIEREYLALVEGRPPARTGTIDAPIGRDRRDRLRHSTDTASPRAAVTHFEIERALPATTLLRVRLQTGRTHQIRVHLREIGHPVVGDRDYGATLDLGLERQFLHAARLAFDHPRSGERVEVVSPLPPDLEDALQRAVH